jgi:hypothetical protein
MIQYLRKSKSCVKWYSSYLTDTQQNEIHFKKLVFTANTKSY